VQQSQITPGRQMQARGGVHVRGNSGFNFAYSSGRSQRFTCGG
jgi:hypothetical protein